MTAYSVGDSNLFAYCGNNPVVRNDENGNAWETVFDIVTLASSVADVIANPTNPWAWAGLVGDVVDLVPFVTGVGETTRAIGTTVRVITNTDNVIDSARTFYNTADAASDIKRSTGSYVVLFDSGSNYVGKGGFARAITSAKNHSANDRVSSIIWASTTSRRNAYTAEYYLQTVRTVRKQNNSTYNIIWSPGRKYIG